VLKEKQINPKGKVKQNKEIFLKAKFSFYKALSFPKRSFTKETCIFSKGFCEAKKCYATKRGDRAYRMAGKDRVE